MPPTKECTYCHHIVMPEIKFISSGLQVNYYANATDIYGVDATIVTNRY